MEFQVIDELAIRAGVNLSNDFQDAMISVGGGINIAGLYVDAAYLFNETLGNTIILSAEFSLGGLLGEDEPVVEEVGTE